MEKRVKELKEKIRWFQEVVDVYNTKILFLKDEIGKMVRELEALTNFINLKKTKEEKNE